MLFCLYTLCSGASYQYPIQNPFLSTVMGTPEHLWPDLSGPAINEINLKIYHPLATGPIPSAFSNSRRATVRFAWQNRPAPLIFLVAGTGARFNASKVEFLKRVFYRAGFHVVQLSSPTSSDFMVNASNTHLPGISRQDASDLYRLMQASLKRIEQFNQRLVINDIYLAGYSLGALDAAFVGALDDRKEVIGFQRILLINPPVYLERSIQNLDQLTRVKVQGVDDTTELFNRFFDQLAEYFRKNNHLDVDDSLKEVIGREVETMSDGELALLIGVAFRFSIASMVFTADIMNRTGLIVPEGQPITVTESRTPFFHRSMHWNFQQYLERLLLPSLNLHRRQQGDSLLTRKDAFLQSSLPVLERWLKKSKNIGVMHNADDLIIDQEGLSFIYDTFGQRAKIYPYGGHMGNLQFSANVQDMVGFIKTGQFPDA
ncbi:hypothetical protein GV64_21860 [Endozoicomonas elysicola]|uniref:Serine/threonine protein kinase n=1 Tax=Endozoicomonas elysicola TaxID=305900 RepID=A0A081KFT3_9GAMM|nr:hypothetical protein GV64_21860 [Endozoicomonas elysicola]